MSSALKRRDFFATKLEHGNLAKTLYHSSQRERNLIKGAISNCEMETPSDYQLRYELCDEINLNI